MSDRSPLPAWRRRAGGARVGATAPMTARQSSGQAAVFLDRDGTMIEDVGYLDAFDRIDFFPWTVDAIRALNRAGFRIIVVTNQSGIARGFFTEGFVQETHRRITARLEAG